MIDNLFLFAFGASIGSFLNVVIVRLPLNLSIVTPRSKCMNCQKQIAFEDNIPIFSWLNLKGKCRHCKFKISKQYFLVELLMGFLFIFAKYNRQEIYYGLTDIHGLIISLILVSLFVTLLILDCRYLWLPSSIIYLGIFFWLVHVSIYSFLFNNFDYFYNVFAGSLGLIIFLSISLIGKYFLKKPVLGFGDAKLSALIGLWLGLEGLLITIYLSFVTSGIICGILLISKKLNRGSKIPFGPFLLLSSILIWFEGVETIKRLIFRI